MPATSRSRRARPRRIQDRWPSSRRAPVAPPAAGRRTRPARSARADPPAPRCRACPREPGRPRRGVRPIRALRSRPYPLRHQAFSKVRQAAIDEILRLLGRPVQDARRFRDGVSLQVKRHGEPPFPFHPHEALLDAPTDLLRRRRALRILPRDRHRSDGLVPEVRLAPPTQPSDLIDEHAVRNLDRDKTSRGADSPHPRQTAFP